MDVTTGAEMDIGMSMPTAWQRLSVKVMASILRLDRLNDVKHV